MVRTLPLTQQQGLYFCLHFGLYTLLCFLFLYALDDRLVVPFTWCIAELSHQALKTIGAKSWVLGTSVGIPGFAVEIKNNCNAIYEIGPPMPAASENMTLPYSVHTTPHSDRFLKNLSRCYPPKTDFALIFGLNPRIVPERSRRGLGGC